MPTAPESRTVLFTGSYVSDPLSQVLKLFAVGIVAVGFLYARDYLRQNELLRGEANLERWGRSEPGGMLVIEQEITRQATMIAYNNAFLAVAVVMIVLIPLVLLFGRRGRAAAAAG